MNNNFASEDSWKKRAEAHARERIALIQENKNLEAELARLREDKDEAWEVAHNNAAKADEARETARRLYELQKHNRSVVELCKDYPWLEEEE